jgi:uncharacterized OB-fold protein
MSRTLPEITPENEAFWTGGSAGRLLIVHCDACDHAIHPPQKLCPVCLSRSVSPRAALGTGTIHARTINRQAWSPDMEVPFALAAVELDGEPGVRLTAKIVDCDPEDVRIGDRVEVLFEEDRGVWIPMFRPLMPA